MKNIVCLILATVLLFSLCIAPALAEDQIVINLFYEHPSTDALQRIIDAFEAKYPQYKVNWIEAPASQDVSHDMLVTSLAAGESIYDVFSCNVIWPAEFSQAGYCLAVDRFLDDSELDLDNFSDGYINAYTFQGKMWGLPWYGNVGILYYRTDIIDTPPETWDELIEKAGEAAGKEGTSFGYVLQAAQYEGLVCNALEFISAYGGTIVDGDGNITINNDGVRAGLTEMKKLVDEAKVPENYSSFMENECQVAFGNGDAVFMRTWPGYYANAKNPEKSKISDKFAVAKLPAGSAGSASTLGGWGWMINKNSEHPQAAWDFISFVTGPEGQKINAIVGGQLPTYMPLYDDEEVLAANPHFADMKNAIEAACTRPVSPIYTALSESMQINISALLAGQKSVDEAVLAMEAEMNEKLAEYNK